MSANAKTGARDDRASRRECSFQLLKPRYLGSPFESGAAHSGQGRARGAPGGRRPSQRSASWCRAARSMEGPRRSNREPPSKGPSMGAFGRDSNSKFSVGGDSRQADIDRHQRAARQQQYIAAAAVFHSGEDKTVYGRKAAIAGVWGL